MADVWVAYYALGGAASRLELEACLAGVLVLDPGECEVLVEATNTLLARARVGVRVPGCVAPPQERCTSDARYAIGAAGAFLLSPQERERERMAAVIRTGLLDTAPEDRFDRISRQTSTYFGVSSAMITVIDEQRCFGKSVIGPLQDNPPGLLSLCQIMLRSGGPMTVDDASRDHPFKNNPLVLGDPHLRFFAGHPIRGPRGWTVGALCVADQDPRKFSTGDGLALGAFARHVEDQINGPRILPDL
ncbi:hypothetical protein IWX63_003221 [Arthrobacter sp. CAN_A2]|uniref:GAF domain-containing protein n=1 Tax=Arthrobacter sp. CAN_A2 TaxID=2787718 RepID=UPI0018EF7C82